MLVLTESEGADSVCSICEYLKFLRLLLDIVMHNIVSRLVKNRVVVDPVRLELGPQAQSKPIIDLLEINTPIS